MARGVAVSEDLRNRVISEWKNGKSLSFISNKLILKKSTVQYIIKHFQQNRTVIQKRRGGSKKITSETQNRVLRRIIKSSRRSNAAELREKWVEAIDKDVSVSTCRRRIKTLGYSFYKVTLKN